MIWDLKCDKVQTATKGVNMKIQNAMVLVISILAVPTISMAKAAKINWAPCKSEIAEFCTTYTADKELHECLEEVPKAKLSKACGDFNKKQESAVGHKDGHAH